MSLEFVRPVLCLNSVLVLLEFRPLHNTVVATYGEFEKRGRPLRELQGQDRVVFHTVNSVYLRILQESPFFAVAFKNEFGGALVQYSAFHDRLRHVSYHLIMHV